MSRNRIPLCIFSVCCVSIAVNAASAEDIPIKELRRSEPVSFEDEILPVLQANCLACHSATERQGDLVLESPEQMLKGGDTGPAVISGNPAESLLLRLATHADEPVMPPPDNDVAARNLTSEELGLLKLWIAQGAKGSGKTMTLSPKSWHPLPRGIQPVLAVSLSPDGQFAACSRANQIFLYHLGTGQLVTRMSDVTLDADGYSGVAHRDLVQSLAFNADGDLLASGGFREVKLWRRPRDVTRMHVATSGKAGILRLSPDAKLLATDAADFSIQIRNISDGGITKSLQGHTAQVTGIRFSSDSTQVYSSSTDKTVLIHDLKTGHQVGKITTESPLNDVALVPLQAATEENPHPSFQIATAGADNVIRIWGISAAATTEEKAESADAEAAEQYTQVQEIKGHSQPVTCLCTISERPQELLSGSLDSTMRWWRTSNAQQVRAFSHGGAVNAIAASPDGQTFASAGQNNSAKLWRTNGQQIAEMKGDIRLNTAITRAEQQQKTTESRVAVAKRQLDEAEKDVPTKTETEKKSAETLAKANADVEAKQTAVNKAREAKIAAEQAAVAAAATVQQMQSVRDKAQEMADQAAEQVRQLQQKTATLQLALNAAPASQELKQLLADAQAAVQKAQEDSVQKAAATKEPTANLKTATDKANAAAQNIDKAQKPFNDSLADLTKSRAAQNLASQQQALAATELKQAQELVPVRKKSLEAAETALKSAQEKVQQAREVAKTAEQPLLALAFSPDGKVLLTGGTFRALHSWDAASGAPIASWEGHAAQVNAIAWSGPDTIMSVADDETLRSWHTNPGWRLERTIGSFEDPETISHRVTAVCFSHDSRLLLAGSGVPSRSGELHLFNVSDGARVLKLNNAHDDTVYAARFSPDASRIASVGADKYLRTFETATGQQLRRFEGHTNYVLSVAWQSDGQSLASGAADNTVKIWDAETGDQKRTVSNFKRHITGLEYAGTTDTLLCVCGDKTVRTVRTSSGGTIRNFSGTASWIHCAAMTPDGQLAAAGDATGKLFVWNATNGQLLHTLENPDSVELASTNTK